MFALQIGHPFLRIPYWLAEETFQETLLAEGVSAQGGNRVHEQIQTNGTVEFLGDGVHLVLVRKFYGKGEYFPCA